MDFTAGKYRAFIQTNFKDFDDTNKGINSNSIIFTKYSDKDFLPITWKYELNDIDGRNVWVEDDDIYYSFSFRIRFKTIPTIIARAVVPMLTTPKSQTAPLTPRVRTEAIILSYTLLFSGRGQFSIALAQFSHSLGCLHILQLVSFSDKISCVFLSKFKCNSLSSRKTIILLSNIPLYSSKLVINFAFVNILFRHS